MWQSLSRPWQVCMEEAWIAYAAGSVPIGSVVTDASGELLSRDRNRWSASDVEPGRIAGNTFAHAEVNALLPLDLAAVDGSSCVLYTTTEPCPLCVGAIFLADIRDVRFASRGSRTGSAALFTTAPYLSARGVRVTGPERADLEAIIVAMNVVSRLEARMPQAAEIVSLYRATVPDGARLGERLFESGELRRMSVAGIKIDEALDRISVQLGC